MSRTSAPSAFRRIMTLMASGRSLADVLDAVALSVEAEAPGALCSVLLLDESGQRLRVGAASSLPDDYNAVVEGVAIGPNAGSCGTAAFRNARVVVPDIQTDPLWVDFKDAAAKAGLRACWSQPIRGGAGEVLGTFAIYHRQISLPDADDIAFIEEAAELATIAIERQRDQERRDRSEALAQQAIQIENDTARNLRTFFDVSLDLLCIRDKDFRFTKVNNAWQAVLGYSIEELEGAPMLSLVHPDDVAETQGHMRRIEVEDEVLGFVNRYRHKAGGYRHLEWRARRVGDFVFGVGRDVTERMALEAEMRSARQAAEAANRAKSEFLANMSHEIRTPLNGVMGVAGALALTPLNPDQQEMVSLIETSAKTLETLLSDILDIARIEAGKMELRPEPFDLATSVNACSALFDAAAQAKGLDLEVTIEPAALGAYVGDAVRIRQILANLLGNAVKFTQAGKVSLTVSARHGERRSALAFVVRDTGIGFDAETKARLFSRFEQADGSISRRFGGSGLGLSISRSLAEAMGGRLEGDAERGRGSVFALTLTLPRCARVPDLGSEHRDPEPGSGALAGLRVLLAEDHPTNRRVVELILGAAGVDLTCVENGVEAVDAFRRGAFDLILMDMQMPLMDGLAAIEAIRRIEAATGLDPTPIHVLTANAMPEHLSASIAAGADGHLSKPILADALLARVAEAAARACGDRTADAQQRA